MNHLQAAGDLPAALAPFAAAVRLAPGHAANRNNLASCLVNLGRHAEGRAEYAAALAAEPGFADAYFNLGYLAEQVGGPRPPQLYSCQTAISAAVKQQSLQLSNGNLYSCQTANSTAVKQLVSRSAGCGCPAAGLYSRRTARSGYRSGS